MEKFKLQSKATQAYKAGLITHSKMNSVIKQSSKNIVNGGFSSAVKNNQFDIVLRDYVQTDEFNRLGKKAYKDKRGYAIGYVKGQKVMYVSGSRNATDWVFNVVDDFIPARLHKVSNHTADNLTKIAQEADVDVVVGHSRGAMLVAKMNIDEKKKLGLDGAMRLAPKSRRHMMNLYQKQLLDRFINKRGTHSRGYKVNRLRNYHFIERDKATGKSKKKRLTKGKKRMSKRKYR